MRLVQGAHLGVLIAGGPLDQRVVRAGNHVTAPASPPASTWHYRSPTAYASTLRLA